MLTRLEVNGFKNLLDFALDFGPLTCIAGPNGVGKSNIFDAIHLLSLLADLPITEAGLAVRAAEGASADLADLFWHRGQEPEPRFTLAAEMLVPRHVQDDFGRPAEATATFLRYELTLALDEATTAQRRTGLRLERERLSYIKAGEALQHLKFPHSKARFRDEVVHNSRRGGDFISTEVGETDVAEILVHQDGGSAGRPARAPARMAPRTIVATTNTSASPTILAARREMQSWRILALEPSAMRSSDLFHAAPFITAQGGHMAAALDRLVRREGEDVYARVANRLASLVPVERLFVDRDEVRRLLTLMVEEPRGLIVPARSLSDGTLRFLALSLIAEDVEARGVMCIEEPENGIHPARMESMVSLLRDIAVDPEQALDEGNPLRQMIIASHSPHLVQLQAKDDLVFAQEVRVRRDGAAQGFRTATTLRCMAPPETWRARAGTSPLGMSKLLDYLTRPKTTHPDAVGTKLGAELP